MKYSEYSKLTGITQSELDQWHLHGTAMDLVEREPIAAMQYGCLFEALIESRATDRIVTDEFTRVDLLNANGNQAECPKEVVAILDKNLSGDLYTDMLKDLYVYKKDGELNGRYETRHKWIDFYLTNQGKIAIPIDIWDAAERCAQSALKCRPFEGDEYHQQYSRFTLEELIFKGEFQVPRQWGSQGVQKKGLLDFVIENESDVIIFDFKLTSRLPVFMGSLKSHGWIQCLHYAESYKKPVSFVYIVGTLPPPYEAGAVRIRRDSITFAEPKYLMLCQEYSLWNDMGRKYQGYRKPIDARLYIE